MITHTVKLSDNGCQIARLLTSSTSVSQEEGAAEEIPKKKVKKVKKAKTPNAEDSGKKTKKKKKKKKVKKRKRPIK